MTVVNPMINGGGKVKSVNGQTGDVVIGANDILPSQTGNVGKILGTDGTNTAWEEKTTVTFRTWGPNE